MEALDGSAVAVNKAGDDVAVLGVLLLFEENERAVHHTDIFHTVAVYFEIEIVVGVVNVSPFVTEQSFIGNNR